MLDRKSKAHKFACHPLSCLFIYALCFYYLYRHFAVIFNNAV